MEGGEIPGRHAKPADRIEEEKKNMSRKGRHGFESMEGKGQSREKEGDGTCPKG